MIDGLGSPQRFPCTPPRAEAHVDSPQRLTAAPEKLPTSCEAGGGGTRPTWSRPSSRQAGLTLALGDYPLTATVSLGR